MWLKYGLLLLLINNWPAQRQHAGAWPSSLVLYLLLPGPWPGFISNIQNTCVNVLLVGRVRSGPAADGRCASGRQSPGQVAVRAGHLPAVATSS